MHCGARHRPLKMLFWIIMQCSVSLWWTPLQCFSRSLLCNEVLMSLWHKPCISKWVWTDASVFMTCTPSRMQQKCTCQLYLCLDRCIIFLGWSSGAQSCNHHCERCKYATTTTPKAFVLSFCICSGTTNCVTLH